MPFPDPDNLTDTYYDLSNEEYQSLEQQSLVQPATVLGKRKASGVLLSPPTSDSGSVPKSSPTATVTTRSFTGALQWFDVPTAAESAEAMEFIGFTPQRAGEIFQHYLDRYDPENCPDSLIDFGCGHAEMRPKYRDLTPREALTRIGLNTKSQDALLDPNFSHIFWTEPLDFWVEDTLRTNHNTLERLLKRMKNQAHRGGRKAEPTMTETVPAIQSSQVTATVNMTCEYFGLPASHIALDSEGPLLPDHLALYQGRAACDPLNNTWIRQDGSLRMEAVGTRPGGDFNYRYEASYWTPQKDVAEEYRKYAARRSPLSQTWLVRIQIPRSFISSLRRAELLYSRDWKEYVWYCKTQRDLPPAKYNHLWRPGGVDVMQGHICTGLTKEIYRIEEGEVQTRITSDHVMQSSSTGGKAIQYVFRNPDIADRLGEVIRGKIHIEISVAALNRQSQESNEQIVAC